MAILTRLGVPGTAEAWSKLAFDLVDGTLTVGRVVHDLDRTPSWTFGEAYPPGDGAVHPNGIHRIDHVVYAVPDLDDAIAEVESIVGEPPRRRARPRGPDGPEMAFFRCGEGFIEVVTSGQPAALWGIAYLSNDLDATVAAIKAAGGPVGEAKPAVQGGRIASIWKGHVGWGIAIMEPPTRQGARHG